MPERLPYNELIKKECIEFGEFLHDNYETIQGGWFCINPYSEKWFSTEEVYDIYNPHKTENIETIL